MASNPWENFPPDIYETHMGLADVGQLQMLSRITKEQLGAFEISSIMILGIAGGNGLEHVDPAKFDLIVGIDINSDFLTICASRYEDFGEKLLLLNLDFNDPGTILPYADLVIANLFLEYVDTDAFAEKVAASGAKHVSVVYQENRAESFVSTSPYAGNFAEIGKLHKDVDGRALTLAMKKFGYGTGESKSYELPNGKGFIRLDFSRMPL
ncbi:MAG: class I SAM-dependent methyltransferase [Fusobacteriaceae bacterium]|jgi:hypothetical protein|nr:class I SAM-dependent methyltransferase [Fusobacteriaceae bacterium]